MGWIERDEGNTPITFSSKMDERSMRYVPVNDEVGAGVMVMCCG